MEFPILFLILLFSSLLVLWGGAYYVFFLGFNCNAKPFLSISSLSLDGSSHFPNQRTVCTWIQFPTRRAPSSDDEYPWLHISCTAQGGFGSGGRNSSLFQIWATLTSTRRLRPLLSIQTSHLELILLLHISTSSWKSVFAAICKWYRGATLQLTLDNFLNFHKALSFALFWFYAHFFHL